MPALEPAPDDRGLRALHEVREELPQEVPVSEDQILRPHLLVQNQRAGRGRAIEVGWRVERLYRDAGIPFELRRTAGPGDAVRIAREGAARFEAVVAVGGDGTFHEVVNGLAEAAHAPGGPGPAGVAAAASMPVGTGNDFVKSLGMRPNPDAAFAALRGGRRRRIDLGRLRLEPGSAPRFFANQIEVGYGGAIVHDMVSPDVLVRRFVPGSLAYVVAGLARFGYATPEIALALDGGAERRARFLEVHIANGRFCGGGISFAPDAALDDGLFDVVTIDALPLHRLIPIMNEVRAARRVDAPGVVRTRARRISLRGAAEVPFSMDGEPYASAAGVLDAEVVPGAIDVIAPEW